MQAGPQEDLDRSVQPQGSRWARVLLRAFGWQIDFDGLPSKQGVFAVYPHTSNWDFPVGIVFRFAMGLPVTFWGKDTLFRVPVLGRWLRWVGGVPVDRRGSRGIVGDMVRRMEAARERNDYQWLALAPEGSRSLGPGWRSGFYQVALRAQVPVALAYIDFGRRRVGVGSYLRLSGDEALDMAEIARRYADVQGRRPAMANPIRLV